MISRCHGQIRAGFRAGPRDVPEQRNADVGPGFPDHPWHESHLVVLHEHHRIAARDLLQGRVSESTVHGHVLLPIGCPEHRTVMGHEAHRPDRIVATGVVGLRLIGGQPDSPQRVTAPPGRNGQPAGGVGGVPVQFAGAVGQPGSAAGLQYRIERRDHSAGRCHHVRRTIPHSVHVWLPAADHDELVAGAEAV
jgi:hypothetical protein